MYYNAMIFLFYYWKSVPFDRLHPFLLAHTPSSGNCRSVFCMCELLVCVLGFFFRYTYKWDHMYFSFSLWLMSLSTMPSRSIHIVSNSKNSFFLWLNYICIRFPWWLNDKESHLTMQELWVWSLGQEDPWGGKIPEEGNGTLFHLPRKSQGQRSLAGYSPRSRKKVRYDLATKQQ